MIGSPSKVAAAGVGTGMRRVSWVRIVVTDAGASCEAIGVGHRLPIEHRVSLETALALAESGVPAIVRSAAHGSRRLQTG